MARNRTAVLGGACRARVAGTAPRDEHRRSYRSSMAHEVGEVVVTAPGDSASAELARAILERHGIRGRVAGIGLETTWTIGSPTAANPLRLYVRTEDAARAREILGEQLPPSRPAPSRLAIAVIVGLLVVVSLALALAIVTR